MKGWALPTTSGSSICADMYMSRRNASGSLLPDGCPKASRISTACFSFPVVPEAGSTTVPPPLPPFLEDDVDAAVPGLT